jgi:hypothetical protein
MTAKEEIIESFRKNVKGKKPNVDGKNERHDGKKGHWLEEQFGISANASNEPDLLGYELKNETTSKVTFGDWSANVYVYTDPKYSSIFNGKKKIENRDKFLRIFGQFNEKKKRFSWSGSPCPKIDSYNDFGQILSIEHNKDIVAFYSFSHDKRPDKEDIVPKELQIENLVIARWYGEHSPTSKKGDKCLKEKLEDKFSKGWFTCKTDENGKYDKICFGEGINYDEWINWVKKGIVIFDSGMHIGNPRPYSEWRANNKFWDSLITETYE